MIKSFHFWIPSDSNSFRLKFLQTWIMSESDPVKRFLFVMGQKLLAHPVKPADANFKNLDWRRVDKNNYVAHKNTRYTARASLNALIFVQKKCKVVIKKLCWERRRGGSRSEVVQKCQNAQKRRWCICQKHRMSKKSEFHYWVKNEWLFVQHRGNKKVKSTFLKCDFYFVNVKTKHFQCNLK